MDDPLNCLDSFQKKFCQTILVRVAKGGKNSQQEQCLLSALDKYLINKRIIVEYLDTETIKSNKMTVVMVVRWLKMSHIHLIITHLHQAVVDYLGWDLQELMERLYQD